MCAGISFNKWFFILFHVFLLGGIKWLPPWNFQLVRVSRFSSGNRYWKTGFVFILIALPDIHIHVVTNRHKSGGSFNSSLISKEVVKYDIVVDVWVIDECTKTGKAIYGSIFVLICAVVFVGKKNYSKLKNIDGICKLSRFSEMSYRITSNCL